MSSSPHNHAKKVDDKHGNLASVKSINRSTMKKIHPDRLAVRQRALSTLGNDKGSEKSRKNIIKNTRSIQMIKNRTSDAINDKRHEK